MIFCSVNGLKIVKARSESLATNKTVSSHVFSKMSWMWRWFRCNSKLEIWVSWPKVILVSLPKPSCSTPTSRWFLCAMACHDGLDQTNCNHAACTASRLTNRYLLHVLFCLHMCVCHERRGSFGIDSPKTSYEPCHSESLTYHLILSPEVGMHGSTWEVKMHIGIYWMKDNQRVFIPFSPQVQSIELQSTHWTSSKSRSLEERLELLQQHMDYMLHHILLPFTGCPSCYWQGCSRFRVHCWENDCTKRAWEINFSPSWQADAITQVMLRIKPSSSSD